MVNSIKDALERARKKLLEDSDAKSKGEQFAATQANQPRGDPKPETEFFASLLTPSHKRVQREEARKRVRVTYGNVLLPAPRRDGKQKQAAPNGVSPRTASLVAPRVPLVAKAPTATPPVSAPAVTVVVSSQATCSVGLRVAKAASLLPRFEAAGRATQTLVGTPEDEREVVLGLDFGTSCVKVVVYDETRR